MIYTTLKTYTYVGSGDIIKTISPGTIGINTTESLYDFGTAIIENSVITANPGYFSIGVNQATCLQDFTYLNNLNQLILITATTIGTLITPGPSNYLFLNHLVTEAVVESNPDFFAAQTNLPFWDFGMPSVGQTVWLVSDQILPITWSDSDSDRTLFSLGLIESTEAMAAVKSSEMYVFQRLTQLADALNGGWVPNWLDPEQIKTKIIFDKGIAKITTTYTEQDINQVWFRNTIVAQQALDYLGQEFYILRDV